LVEAKIWGKEGELRLCSGGKSVWERVSNGKPVMKLWAWIGCEGGTVENRIERGQH